MCMQCTLPTWSVLGVLSGRRSSGPLYSGSALKARSRKATECGSTRCRRCPTRCVPNGTSAPRQRADRATSGVGHLHRATSSFCELNAVTVRIALRTSSATAPAAPYLPSTNRVQLVGATLTVPLHPQPSAGFASAPRRRAHPFRRRTHHVWLSLVVSSMILPIMAPRKPRSGRVAQMTRASFQPRMKPRMYPTRNMNTFMRQTPSLSPSAAWIFEMSSVTRGGMVDGVVSSNLPRLHHRAA